MRVLSRRGWFGKVLGVIGGVVGVIGLKSVSAAVLDEPNELNELNESLAQHIEKVLPGTLESDQIDRLITLLALEKQRREMRLRFVSEPANIETWRTK